ncbi:CcdC protein domain-containing protein, partial [Bacillus altitudinis]|uniref:CcdC protein domain-containing protein n=1 Tax=Bacillus altitudinis TaxID=293387 RepID=UPI00307FCBF6
MFIVIGVVVVGMGMKRILSCWIDYGGVRGMFWIVAFGMIVRWGVGMYLRFRKMCKELDV